MSMVLACPMIQRPLVCLLAALCFLLGALVLGSGCQDDRGTLASLPQFHVFSLLLFHRSSEVPTLW